MKKERIILSFIALLIGLGVAGAAFYFYQLTKPQNTGEIKSETTVVIPTPTPEDKRLLIIDRPKNEEVVTKKSIAVSGKTEPEATVVLRTDNDEKVAEASKDGEFTSTLTIGDGANIIAVTALYEDGSEKTEVVTVTYSTETF